MSLIKNIDQVSQKSDFTGLEWNAIHPTDIDAVIEIDNKYLILIEIKCDNAPIPTGQRLLLERLCNNWQGKSIALKVSHNTTEGAIPLSNSTVTQYYYQHQWHDRNTTLTTALTQIAHNWGVEKLLPK